MKESNCTSSLLQTCCRLSNCFFLCIRCQPQKWQRALAMSRICASWPHSRLWKSFGVCIRICCAQMSCRRIPIITCSERVTAPSLPPKLVPALPYCICNDLFELSPIPYSFFSSGYLPMWESFPSGGCWIIRVRFLPLSTSPVLQHLCCFCFGPYGYQI
jgi:hypothetical protein